MHVKAREPQRGALAESAGGRLAWWSLMACIAALPLLTSITWGSVGGMWALTEDFIQLPKLMWLLLTTGVATVAWVIDVATTGRAFRVGRATISVAVMAAWIALSTAFATEPLHSLLGGSDLMTGAITWLTCLWLSVLVGQYVTDTSGLKQAAWALVGGGSVVALVGVLQALGLDVLNYQIDSSQVWMLMRGSSTLGNPDYTGSYLVAPALVALGLWRAEREQLKRYLAVGAAALCVLGAFVTLTRGAWLGLAAGATVFAVLTLDRSRPEWRKALSVFAAAAAGVLAIGVLIAGPGWVALRFAPDTDVRGGLLDMLSSGRVTMWTDAIAVAGRHPLFGTGADRFALGAYPVQRDLVFEGGSRFVLQDPHNVALMTLGIFGIPALLALGTLLFFVISDARGWLSKATRGSAGHTMYAAWFSALVGVLVTAVFAVTTLPFLFVLLLTVGVVMAPSLKPLENRSWVWMVSAATAVAVIGAGLYGAGLSFAASRHLAQARYADARFHLEEANRLTPWDTRIRTEYLGRKVSAYQDRLTGTDVALAQEAVDEIETGIRLELTRAPGELLLYRVRISLHESMVGAPAYSADAHRAAIESALQAFPGDPEFAEKLKAFEAGVAK